MSYLVAVMSAAPLLRRQWGKKERLTLQNAVRIALPKHRASACLRHRLGGSAVTVSTTGTGGTRLGGLMVCSSAHICPLCHHKKMAEDKATVAEIVAKHYADSGFMVDATLTVPHQAGESLQVVLERLDGVWKSLRSKVIWGELAGQLGVVGCIRRLEVTLTSNGWHPHFHVSFLCDWAPAKGVKGRTRGAVLADVHAIVAGRWADAGERVGVTVCLFAQAAVALVAAVAAEKAVAYSAKNMGYGDKTGSMTPMDLLRVINQIDAPVVVHAARRLFAEYAEAIKGRHVLSFLGAARAAKAGAAETTDRPSAGEEVERLGTVSADAWDSVVKAGLRESLAQVTRRGELVAVVLRASWFAGHSFIPPGWLKLAPEIKTVIEVESAPPLSVRWRA